MKVRINACENYQTLSVEVEVEEFTEIAPILRALREQIKDATSDIRPSKKAPATKKYVRPITDGQIKYLQRLGYDEDDLYDLSFDEASQLISELGGSARTNY